MHTFKASFVSLLNFNLLLFGMFWVLVLSVFHFAPKGLGLVNSRIMTGVMFLIFWILWWLLVKGTTEWEIENSSICIRWLKPFPLTGKKEDILLTWAEVQKVSVYEDWYYTTLTLSLVNGKKLRFRHSAFALKDGFEDICNTLKSLYKEKNSD